MADYIKGVDLSAVVEVEELGAKYYDNGVQGDIFDILKNYGVNSVRLRLWNDPYTEDGVPYGAGTNDLEALTQSACRALSLRMILILMILIIRSAMKCFAKLRHASELPCLTRA